MVKVFNHFFDFKYLRIGRLWAQEPSERQFTNFPTSSNDLSPSSFQPEQRYVNTNLKKETMNDHSDAMQSTPPSSTNSAAGSNNFSRELKRIRDARYKQLKRLMQTDEQKEQQRERKRIKYANLNSEQRENRRRRDCERRRLRWQSLPLQIRSERRARASMKARERRLKMTAEQKERKKTRDRENARQRRLRKKLEQPNSNQILISNTNNPAHNSDDPNVGGASANHVIVGNTANSGVVSLSDVSWLNIHQQPSWMMNMKIEPEPEDYSLVTGIHRRF